MPSITSRRFSLVALAMSLLMVTLAFSQASKAKELTYFDQGIDFWNLERGRKDLNKGGNADEPAKGASKKNIANQNSSDKESQQKFEWPKFLDPTNKEFFREGDYTPPEPFMELVRNPTDNNIRMWFSYMNKKNLLAQRLSQRMEEYSRSNSVQLPKDAVSHVAAAAQRQPLADDEFERYRFRMYFDSQCPHCRHMFDTLNELQDRGYFVEARQVDQGTLQEIRSHVAIVPAGSDEIKKYSITSVPLLLIGDLKRKKVFRQSGFITAEQVLAQIRSH